MTTKEYNSMKEGYYEMVTKIMTESGELGPSITVLGIHKEDGKNAIVHVPVPLKYMKDEDSKDEFMDEIVPKIAERVQEEFEIKAVAWASEAWLRVADKKDMTKEEMLSKWKDLPVKKEVLIISLDSENKNETVIKEIVRKGVQVNEDGELTDHIELIDMPEYSNGMPNAEGRFTNLYQKFTEKH